MKDTKVKFAKFLTLAYQTRNLLWLGLASWGAGTIVAGFVPAFSNTLSQQIAFGVPIGFFVGWVLTAANLLTSFSSVPKAVNQKYMRFADNFRHFIKTQPANEHNAYEQLSQFLILQKDYHSVDLKDTEASKFDGIMKQDLVSYVVQGIGKNKELFFEPPEDSQFVADIKNRLKPQWHKPLESAIELLDSAYSFLNNGKDKYERNRITVYSSIFPEPYTSPKLTLEESLDKIVDLPKLKSYIASNLKKQNISLTTLAWEIKMYDSIKTFNTSKQEQSQKMSVFLAGALTHDNTHYTKKEIKTALQLLSHHNCVKDFLKAIFTNLQSSSQIDYEFVKSWCTKNSCIGQNDIAFYDEKFEEKVREEKANNTYVRPTSQFKNENSLAPVVPGRLEQDDFFKNTLSYFEDKIWNSHPDIRDLGVQIKNIKTQLSFIAASSGHLAAEDLIELRLMFNESVPQIYHYFQNYHSYSAQTKELTLEPTLQALGVLDKLSLYYREKIEHNIGQKMLVNAQYLQNKSQAILGQTDSATIDSDNKKTLKLRK